MVSGTLGSPTSTGWKRRSRAASFSMCLRYSSRVVAPITWSSPRASAGFSMLLASTAPSAAPAPDDGVQLVDEDDEAALALGQFLEHRLQPLLELAPVLGPGQQLADVERDDFPVPEGLGDIAVDDPLGQPLDDGRLAHARLTDQHRVVLGTPRQDLHDPADFLVPPDDRVQLSLAGLLGEVPGEPLQRLVLLLGRLVGHAVGTTDGRQRLAELVGGDLLGAEQGAGGGALLLHQRHHQVLGRDKGIAQGLGFLFGPLEDPAQLPAQRRLGAAAGLRGKAADLTLGLFAQPGHIEPALLEQGLDDPLFLVEEGE